MDPNPPVVSINTSLMQGQEDALYNEDPTDEATTTNTTRYSLAEDVSDSEVFPTIKHKQAALLLHKGYNNEKFESMAMSQSSEIAYEIVHHPVYEWFNFLTAVGLMLLAIGENTSAQGNEGKNSNGVPVIAVYTIELLLLVLLAFNLLLRCKWLGPKLFLRSRGIVMVVIICVMFIEVIVIMSRMERHSRYLRALRPFLLLDTLLMSGVRRVLRQLFECLKYIFDVLLILFFLMAIFSIMAYFLFSEVESLFFDNLSKSFVSILITFTTANHPDVFLEAYNKHAVAPLFFMVYMFVTFYYFSNVLLAVVFAKFKQAEKKKFKKLFIHRRKALKLAYNALKTINGIRFVDFLCCLQQFKPAITPYQAMCVFLAIKQTPTYISNISDNTYYSITWDEFSNLYNYIQLKWAKTSDEGLELSWYTDKEWISEKVKTSMKTVHKVLKHWLFDSVMGMIVLLNLALLIFTIVYFEKDCVDDISDLRNPGANDTDPLCSIRNKYSLTVSFVFLIIYIIEISLRIFFNGPVQYFRKRWNTVDFVLVMGSFICLIVESVLISHASPVDFHNYKLRYLAIARPLVLLRLLKLKRSYLYLLRIMLVLAERLISVFFLLIIVYYMFAIIGMEVFTGDSKSVSAECCVNGSYGIATYYANVTGKDSFFFTSTFETLWSSYVTLYELMVVNNWFIIMEGYVTTTSDAARTFFILFWITTTLVVNTAIVYIVDAFESGLLALQIQQDIKDSSARGNDRELENRGGDLKRVIYLDVSHNDIDAMEQSARVVTINYGFRDWLSVGGVIKRCKSMFDIKTKELKGEVRGHRIMNNDDLREYLYSTDIEVWKEEFEQQSYESFRRPTAPQTGSYKDILMELIMYMLKTTKKIAYYVLG